MRLFEYTKKSNLMTLPSEQQKFIAKMIVRDVKKIATEKNITEAEAYALYSTGLYGGDHEVPFS